MENRRAHLTRWMRTVGWHRRLLAAGLAAAAVALAIHAASPAPPDGIDVVVAGHDLDGGVTLDTDHLTTVTWPPGTVPDGRLTADDAADRVLAGPVRAGEPITDRRLVGPSLLDGWGDDLVAAPVRVADAGAAALLRSGDRIDLLAAAMDGTATTRAVAADVPVLTVKAGDQFTGTDGALLIVAATRPQAADLAQAAVTAQLSFTIGAA